jgi:glyoxylase-like metal-dependent hydrolase (beta-lactamase superfamily II)
MRATFRIGDAEIIMIEDAAGPFFEAREKAFAEATAQQWAEADAYDPEAVFPDGRWLLRFRCYAIRLSSGQVILVDAGIGPADAPAAAWAPTPGRLPDALAESGIAVTDVDTVVLTHVHTDHIGWAVVGDRPYFGGARYLLQAADVDMLRQVNPGLEARLVRPLLAADQLTVLDGDLVLAPQVTVVATPGHTPGHQSVLVADADQRVLITGDLLVHALQLLYPPITYAHDVDPQRARDTRLRYLQQLTGAVLATPHLSRAFIDRPA